MFLFFLSFLSKSHFLPLILTRLFLQTLKKRLWGAGTMFCCTIFGCFKDAFIWVLRFRIIFCFGSEGFCSLCNSEFARCDHPGSWDSEGPTAAVGKAWVYHGLSRKTMVYFTYENPRVFPWVCSFNDFSFLALEMIWAFLALVKSDIILIPFLKRFLIRIGFLTIPKLCLLWALFGAFIRLRWPSTTRKQAVEQQDVVPSFAKKSKIKGTTKRY